MKRGIAYCRIGWDSGYERLEVTHEFAIVEIDDSGHASIPHDRAGHVLFVVPFYWLDCSHGFVTEPNMPEKK